MKPYYVEYYVELKVCAVVMADSLIDAMVQAENEAREISSDVYLRCDDATEIRSLHHLQSMDKDWDGDCIPYGSTDDTRLKYLLPETDPCNDDQTVDMLNSEIAA